MDNGCVKGNASPPRRRRSGDSTQSHAIRSCRESLRDRAGIPRLGDLAPARIVRPACCGAGSVALPCAHSSRPRRAEGLRLEDVPEPEIGINDVLIRVRKTGICGTDLHIYEWDHWAQETIPVPLVVGHEFVGEVVEVRLERERLRSRRSRQRRGPRRLRPLPELHGRPTASVRALDRARRSAPGCLRGVRGAADDEHLAPRAGDRRGGRVDLRPLRERGAHGALVLGAGRGRARHGRGPDRLHGGCGRPSRRRPARRRHRPEPVPARARPRTWARRSASTHASATSARSSASSG